MKNLEKKIIKQVYKLETKKTASQIIFELLSTIFIVFFLGFFISILLDTLNEQGTFNLFIFFNDGFEVIKKYFFENLYSIYLETPKLLIIILILLITLFIILLYSIIKNFKKIKNRLKAIFKFWFKK